MKRVLLLIFIATVSSANAAAQSGRKITNRPPPPPTPEPVQESLRTEPDNVPPGPANMTALTESMLNRPLRSIDNSTFRLADFTGKVIVVNLWATWCGPCRREVPDYEKVRKEYAGRNIEFIALTTEDPNVARERVQKFARDFNFGFRIGWADRETARALMNGRNGIPQTLVIGADGRIVNRWTGYSSSESRGRLREAIDRALSE
jgi:thiol-disulfide isomerase/thioredoxin